MTEEMTVRNDGGMERLDGLAMEARMYSEAAAMNMLQLGRVLTEAKKLVRHGEWTGWISENAHMSETMAQSLMRAYRRFSETPGIEGVERSKLFKMLSLPVGTEERFLQENDVKAMTAREVEQAVRQVRAEAENEIRKERAARMQAEARAYEMAAQADGIPEEAAGMIREKDGEIERIRAEYERAVCQAKDALTAKNALARENADLARDLKEVEEMLDEKQADYDRLQSDFLNAQSAIAKGDAERTAADGVTAADFSQAVRQFIGATARIPHMRGSFARMDAGEREQYSLSLKVVEEWAKGARQAMDAVEGEGVVVDG